MNIKINTKPTNPNPKIMSVKEQIRDQKIMQKELAARDPHKQVANFERTLSNWPVFCLENAIFVKGGSTWAIFGYLYGTFGEGEQIVAKQIMEVKLETEIELEVGVEYDLSGRIAIRNYKDEETQLWIEKCAWIILTAVVSKDKQETEEIF